MARLRWVTNVYGERREITRRWPDGSHQCPWCQGPVPKPRKVCGNPACEAGESMTRETADRNRAREAVRQAEADERARISGIQERMMAR